MTVFSQDEAPRTEAVNIDLGGEGVGMYDVETVADDCFFANT